jgi:acyl transferase domain-containing protein
MSDISRRIANLTPEQRALLEKRLRSDVPRQQRSQPIAVIGLSCRLPGGVAGADAYWQLLRDGVDAISEVPADRWDNAALYDADPDIPGRISSRWGGFVAGVDRFDAAYFGISPREAVRMDPQQRLLLEVAVEAIEDAGIRFEQLAGSETGVFVGAHGHASDYLWLQYADPASMDPFTGTGTAHNLFAGRLSYVFDLHGPAVVVDTACSSSLVAVHLAVQSLRSGESSLALAGGVNLILGPHFSIAASRMHMLAPDGRCKAFDLRADGFVRSEGCGVVVLKRLTDALADGDPVRAVIRGSAMNQDGHTNGITAPSGVAQRAVIERALRDAGIDGRAVGYVEAHGTGTALGDPIEVEALAATVGNGAADDGPCFLGSVKTNIGHLEGAAGVAGLIKAVLVLQHRQIPKNLHFTGLNPHISLAGTRFVVPTALADWRAGAGPRVAGVSSFGWSGTNTHVVLEEAPERVAVTTTMAGPFLLPVSARSRPALESLVHSYHSLLAAATAAQLGDVCATAALHRTHHDHRAAAVAHDGAALATRLRESLAASSGRRVLERPRIVFVFPGQGSQWAGMGRSLLRSEPAFRIAIEQCDAAIRAEAGWSLTDVLEGRAPSDDIGVLQPTLFAVQVALAALWRSWGIVPEAVVGHSMGEVAAACVAGILDLGDATRVICRRSALLRRIVGRGAMALVELPMDVARGDCAAYADRVAVAVSNGPRSSVLSGDPDALNAIIATLTSRNVFCRPVKVDVASHSPQVDGLRAELLQSLAGIAPRNGQVPLYSTVEATQRRGRELGPEYWVRNLREPVRFFDAIQQLLADGFDAFVEISPHPILLPAVDDAIAEAGADAIAVVSLRRDQDERSELFASLARLYCRGASVDWAHLWPKTTPVAALPPYPWQRERFWIDEVRPNADLSWMARDSRAAAGEDTRNWLFTPQWRASPEVGAGAAPERGTWLLLADRSGRGAELATVLAGSGQDVWLVHAADEFAVTGPRSFDARPGMRGDFDAIVTILQERGARIAGIVHLWNIDAPTNDAEISEIERFQVRGCASVAFLIQALVTRELERPPRIKIVTQGAQSPEGRAIALAQSPVWGLGRVIAEEHPEFWGGLLDLDPAATHSAAAEFIARELGAGEVDDGVAQSAAGRHVLRLAVFAPKPGPEVVCDPGACYLVTGGLGAVGLETARWLVERGARHLLLAGRNSIPPRERWMAPEAAAFAERIGGIQRLEAMGAVVESVALDIADAAAVDDFLRQRTAAGQPPIRGIVHAAADTGDCLVIELDVAKLMKVLRPKLVGALLIERATRRMRLDFLILHSSLGSLLGQPGHPSYAAANAFLDALALDVRHRGRHALAVNWAAWADLGLAQTEGGQRTIGELERRGIRSFSAAAGTEALGRLLAGDAVTAVVAPADWTRFVEASRTTRVPSIVRDLGHYEPTQAARDRPSARQALDAASGDDRLKLLVDLLKMELAQVLRLPLARIDSEIPMGNLGLESLTALELRKRLETSLGLRLSATVMWNYPTIALLAGYLLNRLYGSVGVAAAAVGAPRTASPPSAITTEMSEEEAIRSLIGQGRSGS